MTDRNGIFAGDNPFDISRRWLAEATEAEVNDPNAAALASVDEFGMPNVRVVLIKDIEDDGFVYYTNFGSAKSQEMLESGKAAFNIHWKSLRRQIRVRGLIEKEDSGKADEYYMSRPLGSRVGAYASRQSQPLESRAALEQRLADLEEELGATPPRPEFWGGFKLIPLEIEFWSDGANRLHDRFLWTRKSPKASWHIERLYP
jgi:pyridoxamine 5'-phosphate oxidase